MALVRCKGALQKNSSKLEHGIDLQWLRTRRALLSALLGFFVLGLLDLFSTNFAERVRRQLHQTKPSNTFGGD